MRLRAHLCLQELNKLRISDNVLIYKKTVLLMKTFTSTYTSTEIFYFLNEIKCVRLPIHKIIIHTNQDSR